MGTVEYIRLLSSDDIEEYLTSEIADVKQSIICNAMHHTVIVHDNNIYCYDLVQRYFKLVTKYSNNALESLVTQFVGKSLQNLRDADRPAHVSSKASTRQSTSSYNSSHVKTLSPTK